MGYLPSLVLLINMYTIVEGRIGARVPTVKTTSFELNKKTLLLLFFINCWNEIGHNVSVSNSLFLPCFFFFFCIIIFLLAHAHPPPPLFPSSVRIKCKQKQLGSGYSMRFLSRRPHGRNIRSRFIIFLFFLPKYRAKKDNKIVEKLKRQSLKRIEGFSTGNFIVDGNPQQQKKGEQ